MRRPLPPRPHRARRRRGFTLTEILIAMTLMAIVISAVVTLLLSQSRFVSRISGDVAALDQAAVAEEMLRTEVASLPAGALLLARPDSLAFRLPLSWGVVCGPLDRSTKASGAKKKGKTPVAYSTTAALVLEPAAAALGNPTPDGIALSPNGTTFTYLPVNPWSTLGLAQSATAAEACVNRPTVAAGKKDDRGKDGDDDGVTAAEIDNLGDYWSSPQLATVAGGTMPSERTFLFTYGVVTYYFKAEGAAGVALYRATSAGAQPVAGPFTAQAGFSYRLASGTTATAYAGATLSDIRAIRATLPAVRERRGAVSSDTVSLNPWLHLVNAR